MFGLLLPAILEGFAMSAAGVAGAKAAGAVWERVATSPEKAKGISVVVAKLMQAALCAAGYKIKVDGRFGKETDRAVRAFQSSRHLWYCRAENVRGSGRGPRKTWPETVGRMMTEEEKNAALNALEDTPVIVRGGFLKDEMTFSLTRSGAKIVLDKLKAYDFVVQKKGN